MARYVKLEYSTLTATPNVAAGNKSISIGAVQTPNVSGLTSLTGQDSNLLGYDTTLNELCLSDSIDDKFHPIRAIPFIQLSKTGAGQAMDDGAAGDTIVTWGAGHVVAQHNVLLDAANNELQIPAWCGPGISIVELDFAIWAVSNALLVLNQDNSYPILYRQFDGNVASTMQFVFPYSPGALYIFGTGLTLNNIRWTVFFPGHGGWTRAEANDYIQT